MKRLILILGLFSVMISFAIIEIVYTNKVYSTQHELLLTLEEKFDLDPENLDNEQTYNAFYAAFNYWNKHKKYLLIASNHNYIKFIDEKYVSIKQLIRLNQQYDAYVTLNVLKNYIKEIKKDNHPSWQNFI